MAMAAAPADLKRSLRSNLLVLIIVLECIKPERILDGVAGVRLLPGRLKAELDIRSSR